MQAIHRQLREDGVCILTFDRPDAAVNLFDVATLEELAAHIEALSRSSLEITGLVFLSAKPSIFIAGADLRSLSRMAPGEMGHFIDLGQQTFSAIAALPYPTVAAIHGACVGGGYELALACHWRVATEDRSTKIGLPETKLGILPAWGGCTRLPRLIGLTPALKVILGGQTLPARTAFRLGMIDAVASHEHLLEAALPFLQRGTRRPRRSLKDSVIAPFVLARVRKQTAQKTRGHYPAVLRALDVAVKASGFRDLKLGLAMEKAAVLELAQSPVAANLMRLFFLQERAKKLALPGVTATGQLKQAAVIGSGVMGAGIAQWLSSKGIRVLLRDLTAERLAVGMEAIAQLYTDGVKRRIFTAAEARQGQELISPSPAEVPLHRRELVIEAAVEKMETKQALFRRLDALLDPETILATNTSALSIATLARATEHPERVIGLHFFNPVHRMPLVEVIVTPETAPAVAAQALRFVQQIGKSPVLVKDSPGFVVNRILLPGMVEAVELFTAGTSAAEIDAALVRFGLPMGPLRLIDEVGVDVALDVARTLAAAFPKWMLVPELLVRLQADGLLGRKTGRGFYRYDGEKPTPNPEARALCAKGGAALERDEIARRVILLMLNEAARCLEEKIVETPANVDLAMMLGAGFPPFRGGPLRYADSLGAPKIVEALDQLSQAEPRFEPCALLRQMARENSLFYENSSPSS